MKPDGWGVFCFLFQNVGIPDYQKILIPLLIERKIWEDSVGWYWFQSACFMNIAKKKAYCLMLSWDKITFSIVSACDCQVENSLKINKTFLIFCSPQVQDLTFCIRDLHIMVICPFSHYFHCLVSALLK